MQQGVLLVLLESLVQTVQLRVEIRDPLGRQDLLSQL